MSNSLHKTNQDFLSTQDTLNRFEAKHKKREAEIAKRRGIGAAVIAVALLVTGGSTLNNMNTDYQVGNVNNTIVTKERDTLFSLAKQVPGSEHVDIRMIVEQIEKLNPDTIVNGVVPAYAEIIVPASIVEEGEIVDDAAVPDNN